MDESGHSRDKGSEMYVILCRWETSFSTIDRCIPTVPLTTELKKVPRRFRCVDVYRPPPRLIFRGDAELVLLCLRSQFVLPRTDALEILVLTTFESVRSLHWNYKNSEIENYPRIKYKLIYESRIHMSNYSKLVMTVGTLHVGGVLYLV